MHYRHLGNSGIMSSVLAFGAWQIGDPKYWGPDGDADADEAVGAALEAGINLFDTAEGYGNGESERVLGRTLGRRRKDVLIASKVFPQHCEPKRLRQSCESSLERLGTDWIDLYQVHWPFRHVPFEDAYGEMARLREEGKIRAIGLSNFGPRDLAAWMGQGHAVSNQVGYNLLTRTAEVEVIPASRRYGLGVLVYMPLLQGILAGRWDSVPEIPQVRRRFRHFAGTREGARHGESGCEDLLLETLAELKIYAGVIEVPMAVMSLAWLIAQPGVTSVLVGARKAAQLRENLAAAERTLGPEAIAQINEITYPLKRRLGFNADMWEGEMHSRIR